MSKNHKSKPRKIFRKAFRALLVLSIWAGLGVTALVAWYAADLPKIIASPHFERKASITFKASDNTLINRYGELTGISVSVAELPPYLVNAVLATEDRRFYQHRGVDLVGLSRAMAANVRAGAVVQGGSTITQQLAKNLFLSPERTIKRKIQEALLALWLETKLSKDEILSAYLNRVYLGGGAYGVDAAAKIYFNKSAREVNLREAAMLAGLLKAPSRYSPAANPGLAAKRARVVLSAMADAGYITPEEAQSAILTTPVPRKKPAESGGDHYFTDWIADGLDDLIGPVKSDLVVHTTMDPAIQKAAETALARVLRERGGDSNATQGAVIVMDHEGAVLAMVGGRDYDLSQFNRAAQALRPPGSSFKPIVYLTALEMGWEEDDLIKDAPLRIGKYRPQNYKGEYFGEVPLKEALAKSLNTAAVRLAQKVGIDNITATARRLGIRSPLAHDLSIALGSNGVPMMEMVGAYAVFANGGYSVHPYAVTSITDDEGRLFYQRMALRPGRPMFSDRALDQLDDMLGEVVLSGTGKGAALPDARAAGKTGTSQDFRDAWFIGYTDCCVAGVWVGNDDNSSMKRITGGSLPASVWRETMTVATKRRQPSSPWPNLSLPGSSFFTPAANDDGTDESRSSGGGFTSVIKRLFND